MGNGNFKIGDRVKRIAHPYDDVKIGTIGIVTKINEDFDTVCVKIDSKSKEGTWAYSYIEKIENSSVAIIQHKGRETIATLKDGKNVLKTAKATCNPSDTFNAEFGRALAIARLNDDQKMIDWLLRGEEKPFVHTQSRIVKQDRYEVGDKVKIREDLNLFDYFGNLAVTLSMRKMAGKIVTITNRRDYSKDDTMFRYSIAKSGYSWTNNCFEGKVIEESITSEQPITAPVITLFDWKGFKAGKFAVHCNTEEKASQFFDELKMQGIKWNGGEELNKDDTQWNHSKSGTAYRCRKGRGLVTGDTQYYQKNGTLLVDYTPNYHEVKRPAKVGEWIKVVSAKYIPTTNGKDDYKNGDVLKIPNIDLFAGKPRYAQGIGDNGIARVLNHDEYVVLVPITPTIEAVAQPESQYKEVKRLADVGDLIKIVKEGVHGPDLIIGDIHKVERKDDFGGLHTDKRNVFNDYNQDEYVVLEPVNLPVQPKTTLDLTSITTDALFEELRKRVHE